MPTRRVAGLVASGLAAGVLAVGAQNPPAGQTPAGQGQATFRTRIDSVMVDVQVLDKQGKPVTDLTQQDFEIKENNKLQTIDTFKFIKLDDATVNPDTLPQILSVEDQEREIENDQNRLLVIFLDDYHVRLDNGQRIRVELAKFVNNLDPRTLVAVMYPLMPVSAMTFGRNHSVLASEMMAFRGRKGDYTPMNPVESQLSMAPPEIIEQQRNTIVISALDTLCAYMGARRDGRKQILVVTEGFNGGGTSAVLGGMRAQSQSPIGGANLISDFEQIFADAARSNTSLYMLDARGLAVNEFGATRNATMQQQMAMMNEAQDSLHVLAENTGGRAIVGSNDPQPMLKQMLRDSSAYYLLSYTSTEKPRDAKFHPIKVAVLRKDARDGTINARKGYWAYSADEVTKMTAAPKAGPPREIASALEALSVSRRGHSVRVWTGAARGADGKAQITFAWEAIPQPAGESLGAVDHVTVSATSIAGEQLFSGDVARDPQATTPAGRVSFAAPPGTTSVKAVAETAKGLRLDSDDLDVEVPDFTSVGVFITTPVIFRARTARDIQQIRAAAPPPVPAATREFLRSERLLIRFQAYAPGGAKPAVTAHLLNAEGQSIAELPDPAAASDGTFDIDLGLGTVAAADYLIEITAESGGQKKKVLLPIRVTG